MQEVPRDPAGSAHPPAIISYRQLVHHFAIIAKSPIHILRHSLTITMLKVLILAALISVVSDSVGLYGDF